MVLLATVLLAVGLVASLPIGPAFFALIVHFSVLAVGHDPAAQPGTAPPAGDGIGFPAGTIAMMGAACTFVTGLCLSVSSTLMRGRRGLVLFLRRFGHREVTETVTFAVSKTTGRSWRMVTLDDSAIAPVGTATRTLRTLHTTEQAWRVIRTVAGTVSSACRRGSRSAHPGRGPPLRRVRALAEPSWTFDHVMLATLGNGNRPIAELSRSRAESAPVGELAPAGDEHAPRRGSPVTSSRSPRTGSEPAPGRCASC